MKTLNSNYNTETKSAGFPVDGAVGSAISDTLQAPGQFSGESGSTTTNNAGTTSMNNGDGNSANGGVLGELTNLFEPTKAEVTA